MSLLEKAKNTNGKINKTPSKEEIDLALAWARDEIKIFQVEKAIGATKRSPTVTYTFLSRTLKYIINNPPITNL